MTRAGYIVMRFLYIFLIIALSGCAVFRQLSDPVTGVLKRGSCISIDLPPITLTPERTAAERQLIGENRELESQGWLIASSQSSRKFSRGDSSPPELENIRQLHRERGVLDFYRDLVIEYRNRGIFGEGLDGRVVVMAHGEERLRSRAEIRKVRTIADEVNRARMHIYKYYRERESKKRSPDYALVEKRHLGRYRETAPRGVWIQDENKRWVRKR